MKRLLATLLLFAFVATSQAVTITYLNTNDYIGNSRDTINDNFSNLNVGVSAAITNVVVVTPVSSSSNWVYWVSNSTDGAISYWLSCLTNGSGAAFTGFLYGVASDASWLVVSNGFGAAGLGTATFHPTNAPNFVYMVTNVYRAVVTSSVDFVSWESNSANRSIAYYVFCSTNGGGGGGAGDVTNELSYDLTMQWGSPRWATTNNAIDLTTRVANDTLSTHTATTAVDCMIFSATCTSNIMQDVTRGFWIEMKAGTRTNFQVLLKADQTTNGNFAFLFYNPGGIGPVAYGITGGVSAANTTTTLNIPTAGTFLTNVARGVLVHGDLTCTSFSTNANNMRLQGIMGFKEQR